MLENLDFEQDYYSRTATGVREKGHDSNRLMKWLVYHDRSSSENIYYYELVAFVLKYLNEIP